MRRVPAAGHLLAAAGTASLLAGAAAALFFFGGFFSVAADDADPWLVDRALIGVRQASITRHAADPAPGNLADPAVIRAGAQAYAALGCAGCHGAPGVRPQAFSAGLNPRPNLRSAIDGLTPPQLFWVLQHGIKMSGMPGFGAHDASGERARALWAVAAFLKRQPKVSAAEYAAWTARPPG